MPQLQRTEAEVREMPERQRKAGADVFEDLFTSFFGGPGKPGAALGLGVPGAAIPSVTSGFRGLGPVMSAGGTGLPGGKAAMMGDVVTPLLARIQRMARRLSPAQSEDLFQTGAEAVTRGMQQTSMGGGLATKQARSAMLSAMREGKDVGHKPHLSAVKKALERKGESAGEFALWSEARKYEPKLTLERFRKVRAGIGQKRTTSLDAPIRQGEAQTAGDLLRSTDDPLAAQMLREQFDKLTPAQSKNLDKYLAGEPVNRAIVDRILKKLGVRGPVKPISGGGFQDISGFRPGEVMNEPLSEQLPLSIRQFWEDIGPSGNAATQIPALGQGRLTGTTQALEQGVQLPSYPSVVGAHPMMRSTDRFVPGAKVYDTQEELDQLRSLLLDAAITASKN